MKIKRIIIINFKSIKEIDFQPNGKLNAFIGANSVGKSNIFDAINWLLGPTYPTFNSTKKEDHFLGDESNKIFIKLEFDDAHSLEMNEHKEVTRQGETEIKSGLFYDDQSWNCKGGIREVYCSAYLGVDREILEYLPSNKWSLVGRILQEINKKFLVETYLHDGETKLKKDWLEKWLKVVRDKLLFSVKDDSGEEVMKKFIKIIQEESARQLNKPVSDFEVDLSLNDPWNFYKTLQLIVHEHDMDGLKFQASNLGMGVQASISIAILKAYSEINLANRTPIFIDEPELFLHPQAQRNFFKILRDLSEDKKDDMGNLIRQGTQVFYTTHSPNFLSTGTFDQIFLVRKTKELGTYIKFAQPDDFVVDLKKRKNVDTTVDELMLHYQNAYENTGDTQRANEGFFAKKLILVEGSSENLVLPYLFDLINFDFVKSGISIVSCGGKSELDRFYRLYTEFGIPCYLIFDGDKRIENEGDQTKTNRNLSENKVILTLFGDESMDYPDNSVKARYLGFTDRFEDNLGFTTDKKGLELFLEVKSKIKTESNVPGFIKDIKQKLDVLEELEVKSVLLR